MSSLAVERPEDPRSLRARAAKLRMLQYLSEPALPFFPQDAAA